MQQRQLQEIIDYVLEALDANREVVTPVILAKAQDWLTKYKDDQEVRLMLAAMFSLTEQQVIDYFAKAQKVLDIEKKLIQTDLTDTIADGLIKLKGRPIVMRMLAALI